MRVGIIGCGLIGRKRAQALSEDDYLAGCCDSNPMVAKKFSEDFQCEIFPDSSSLIFEAKCDIIVVAVINKYTREVSEAALKNGIHVLAEKPLGRNAAEAESIVFASETSKKYLKTGFNHRFHPGILKAKELFDKGLIGNLMLIRGIYGHGSRPGMETEWRSSFDLCGGGELLDQGVHLIDLSMLFSGKIKSVFGRVKTKFWNIEVEDNACVLMESENGVDIQLQVSWTNWKNIFSFSLIGTDGYLRIEGLGGSYGNETLEFGKRKPEGGKPDIDYFEFPPEDVSWVNEWKEFKSAIHENRRPVGDGFDGLCANQVIDAIYKSSQERQIIIL